MCHPIRFSYNSAKYVLTLQTGEQHQNSNVERSGGGGDTGEAEKVRPSGGDDALRYGGGSGGKIMRDKAGAGDESQATVKSGDDEPLVSSLKFGTGNKQGPTGDESDAFVDELHSSKKKDGGDGKGKQQRAKQRKGRLVPGSLVLTSLSASDLPDTEKGVFSKQV